MADLFDEPAGPASPRATRPPQIRQRTPAPRPTPHPDRKHPWQQVRVYTYTTITGAPVLQVIRQECDCDAKPGRHKRFLQRYRHGRQWEWKKPEGLPAVLYRARALVAADPQHWVYLTEGEKDAETAAAKGVIATTNPQGAGAFPAELADQLAGCRVAIVIDRDRAGYQRGLALNELLAGTAAEIALLLPAATRHKADLTDHVDAALLDSNRPFGGLIAIAAADLENLIRPRE